MTPYFYFFFFNDTATTEIYTLSLHDALPICQKKGLSRFTKTQALGHQDSKASAASAQGVDIIKAIIAVSLRSEEHTSELQSQSNLVCRLLLEKKKHHMYLRRHRVTTRITVHD